MIAATFVCFLSTAWMAQQAADIPRHLAFDEPVASKKQDPVQDPYPPIEPSAPKGSSFIDFDWLELHPGIGVAVYSSKYRADPGAGASLLVHAPLPWLSPASDPGGEYFGAFAAASFTSIDRNLSQTVDHRHGIASFYTLGMDYSFLRDSTWILVGRGGLLYAYYNKIADLKSGVGFVVGLSMGIQISGKLGLTYGPDVLFGESGSVILLNTLGLLIQF